MFSNIILVNKIYIKFLIIILITLCSTINNHAQHRDYIYSYIYKDMAIYGYIFHIFEYKKLFSNNTVLYGFDLERIIFCQI